MPSTTTGPSPLDREPRRIDLSTEEQWFVYRVLRGRLRRIAGEDADARSPDGDPSGGRHVAAALGKVEAGVTTFTAREARRLREAVAEYARDPAVSFAELGLSMAVVHRIEGAFDLPEGDPRPRRPGGDC